MNILCLSDTHGHLPVLNLNGIDLVIHCGDYTNTKKEEYLEQLIFFEDKFCPWVRKILDCEVEFFYCNGNHETFCSNFQVSYAYNDVTEKCLLDDRSLQSRTGLSLFGFPYTNRFGDYAFNLDDTPEQMGRKSSFIPAGIDVVVSHGPVFGINDVVDQGGYINKKGKFVYLGYIHAGSKQLAKRIDEINPKLLASGHLHDRMNYNVTKGSTKYVGCCVTDIVDGQYVLNRKPVLITL